MRHAEALARAGGADRSAYAFTPVPDGFESALDYIARALTDQAAGRSLPFALISTADERVVGSTRFLELDYWRGPLIWPPAPGMPHGDPLTSVPDAAEIGNTWIAGDARGTGINTEAKYLMFRHAFEAWGVRRITMRADARNTRSRIAIERLGASCEGVRRAHSAVSTEPSATRPSTRSSTRNGRPSGTSSSSVCPHPARCASPRTCSRPDPFRHRSGGRSRPRRSGGSMEGTGRTRHMRTRGSGRHRPCTAQSGSARSG